MTFGCLNNFSKINPSILETWRALLASVANSRLILSAHQGSHRRRVQDFLSQAGVSPDRLEFHGVLPFAEYLDLYNRIDIALDPFPYPGGTTSFDALYMGVPVITLPGHTAVSRAGVSILEHLGLPEFIARSSADYTALTSRLAADTGKLAGLRGSLRSRLLSSTLTDARLFTRSVESAFRNAWVVWCGK